MIYKPIKAEEFTPFAKQPARDQALHFHVRGVSGHEGRDSNRELTSNPNLPCFRPLPGYMSAASIAGNSHQQVVGRLYLVNSGAWLQVLNHGFLHSNGVMHDLGTLPGYQISAAVAINNHGMIAGYSQENSMDGGTPCHAVYWVHRKIRDLGIGHAFSISSSGNIVGDSSSGQDLDGEFSQARLWAHGCRYDLNNCIPPRSGWVLSTATHVSDNGQIAGQGLFHGKVQAFLLTPSIMR